MSTIRLGCIADDFTGATDLANNLVRGGMRVMQTIGVPTEPIGSDIDAVVVALKTRTCSPADAAAQSLAALVWLQSQGAQQIYFKYCSTFDSTASGNIGPVTDALMDALGTDFTIACPAFPDNGRTVFKGYLFVGDELLHESGMRNHPLTPMLDSNLVRVLQTQTPRKVGLIGYKTVAAGSAAITARIAELKASGVGMAIVDATSNAELIEAGKAWKGMPLVTAGSGIAIGLPQNFGIQASQTGIANPPPHASLNASQLPAPCGLQAIVSGSCSVATNGQVAHFIAQGGAAFQINPMQLMAEADTESAITMQAIAWAQAHFTQQAALGKTAPILVYATSTPEQVKAVQAKLGVEKSGELIERTLAAIAKGLVQMGVQQLVVAGGETSGACVQALGVTQLRIGPQIAPGVPWCYAQSSAVSGASGQLQGLHIALKSGNFGSADFFCEAFAQLSPPL